VDGLERDGIPAQNLFNRVARPKELAKEVCFSPSDDSELASRTILDFNAASYLRI